MSRVTKIFTAAAVAVALLPAARALAEPVTYDATFTPLNNSGVTATANLVLDGSSLTVSVIASGLVPDQNHPQHIHGFASGQASVLPPFPPTVDIDTNANGLLDDAEAELLIGPPILGLTGTNSTTNISPTGSGEPGGENLPSVNAADYPVADANGNLNYSGTFTVTPSLFSNVTRALEIHGLTVNDTYDATMPVASALITFGDNSGGTGGGGGGGGNAIPLPAAAWTGMYMLTGLGGASAARKRLRKC